MGLLNAGSCGYTTEPPVSRWLLIPWVSWLAACCLYCLGRPRGLQYGGCHAAKGRCPHRSAHVVHFPSVVCTEYGCMWLVEPKEAFDDDHFYFNRKVHVWE